MEHRLTTEQRARLIELFYEHGRSGPATVNAYRRIYGRVEGRRGGGICTAKTVLKTVAKFRRHHSVADAPRAGRPKRSEDEVGEVEMAMNEIAAGTSDGQSSVRAISAITGIPRSSVHSIMRKDLQMFPYKIQMTQVLLPGDPPKRYEFCQDFLAQAQMDGNFLDSILFSDEAIISLNGHVNRQNFRIWSRENPHRVRERPLHPKQINMWMGFTSTFMIGPYFYGEYDEEGELKPFNVNSQSYLRMITDYVVPALQQHGFLGRAIIQQDGAPAHTAGIVREYLENQFGPERVISLGFPRIWPPRSPDLAPCDYYLWGHLKDLVYGTLPQPQTMEELCNLATRCSRQITQDQLRGAVNKLLFRAQKCLDNGGGHFEHEL